MVSHDNLDHEYESVQKAVLILIAAALNILELFIPRIPLFPWLKPGLANSITLIWIVRYGAIDALLFSIIRVWISSFYFGFSLVTIALALSGGLCATVIMGCLLKLSGGTTKNLGTVGIAIIGALFHNIGQLAAVYLFLTHNTVIFYQLPFMGIASLLFGSFTGCVTPVFWKVLTTSGTPAGASLQLHRSPEDQSNDTLKNLGIVIGIAGAFSILAVSDHTALIIIASTVTLLAFFTGTRKPGTLFHPLRFWFLFIFIAIVDLFFSYGNRVSHLLPLTYEGLSIAATQSLRLWIWIEISLILHKLQCSRLLFTFLEKIFPNRGATFAAGLFALEFFPDVLLFAKSGESRKGLTWRKPLFALSGFIARVNRYIIGQIEKPMLKESTSPPR